MARVRIVRVNETVTQGKNCGRKRSPCINKLIPLQQLFKAKASLLKARYLGKCLLSQAPCVKIETLLSAQIKLMIHKRTSHRRGKLSRTTKRGCGIS